MSSWNQSPYVGYKPPNWRDTPYTPKPTYEDIFGVKESQEAINYRLQQEGEERRKLQEKRRADEAKRKEKEAAELMARAKGLAPAYRDSYDAEDPQTFKDAKRVADETYMQFWYDKANAITDKWTDEDYRLLVEEETETYLAGKHNSERKRRKFPEGYEEYMEIKENIDYGVLDFNSEEDHRKLINPPTAKNGGYGKYQTWISEDDPLRQAVDAQSAVMKEWLDEANVDLVIPYEDLDGFKRPDPMRGEGLYLDTGTGAHIDWDSGRLKRMQSYRNVGGEEGGFGEYSTSFIRPDPDYGTFGKVISVIGTITGNPVMRAIGTGLQGGDWKDIAKGHLAAEYIVDPILEDTLATLGVDADLLGIDPETFTDSVMEVQTAMLSGDSGTDAIIGEFTDPIADKVVDTVKEVLPDVTGIDIDFDTPVIIKDIGDVALAGIEAVGDFVEPIAKEVVDVGQSVVDVAQEVTQPISDVTSDIEDVVLETGRDFDDTFIDPIDDVIDTFGSEVVDPTLQTLGEVGQDIIDPIDAFIDAIDSPLGDLLGAGGDLLGGILSGQGQQQQRRTASTPTEGLFDKELFKFDTEIKSTQEMLSPMMNLRKYG